MHYTKQVIKLAQRFEALAQESFDASVKDVADVICQHEKNIEKYLIRSPMTYLIGRFDPKVANLVLPGIDSSAALLQLRMNEINNFYDSIMPLLPSEIHEEDKRKLRKYKEDLEGWMTDKLKDSEWTEYFKRLDRICDGGLIGNKFRSNTFDSIEDAVTNIDNITGD